MLQPKDIIEFFINNFVRPGDFAVDATAGNGYDTQKLCEAVGKDGTVLGFDIQKCAIETTEKRLKENGFSNFKLICDSHSNIDKYVNLPVSAVIFNLGYLPGGNHNICTQAETTIKAIDKSLELLIQTGFIAITVYYGKNSGTKEKDALMEYFKSIDHKKYTVTTHDFYNRPNNPPLTVIIRKN